MSTVPIVTVDAFAERPFTGNPAGVVLLDAPADLAWMQAVAAEMHLSETAFLHPEGIGWRLRWFTPTVEVDLCGHATLASAHRLREVGRVEDGGEVVFYTRSGLLRATAEPDRVIALDFPALPPREATAPDTLLEALNVRGPRWVGRSRYDWLVEVADEAAVREVQPDFRALCEAGARGVMVTSRGRDHDVVSRFFAPGAGIDEDPVTGSAHCVLGPYWATRLGRTRLDCWQASERGGRVDVEVRGDRVALRGHAVTVLTGEILGP
jgi:PhzF family phenazine biosynthesis protein